MELIKPREIDGPTEEISLRARHAISAAERRGIPPDPRAFEVFFAYLEGRDPSLVAAVDASLSETDGPNLDALDRIHDVHIQGGERGARQLELGRLVEQELGGLSASLARRVESDDAFIGRLSQARDGMSLFSRPGAVKQMLRELIETSEAYAEQTEMFAAELKTAHAQIEELHAELQAVRESAFIDHLTGLSNRRRFDVTIEYEISASQTRGAFSLVLVDLDHFKRVNDVFGHPVGDSVLKQFARILSASVQGKDTPARYGGEEFAIILPKTNLLGARHVAERIRQDFASRAFVVTGSRQKLGSLTASFGVAEHQPGEVASALIQRADAALYRAKEGGRNRVVADS